MEMCKEKTNVSALKPSIFFLTFFFFFFFAHGCMKRNIYSGLGGGAGIPPESGMAKIKISPGEFDEDIQGVIELKGVYRIKTRDIIPVFGYGVYFPMREVSEKLFPYFGTVIEIALFRTKDERKFVEIGTSATVIVGTEKILNENISVFYEVPIGIGTIVGNTLPRFMFLFGILYYFKR